MFPIQRGCSSGSSSSASPPSKSRPERAWPTIFAEIVWFHPFPVSSFAERATVTGIFLSTLQTGLSSQFLQFPRIPQAHHASVGRECSRSGPTEDRHFPDDSAWFRGSQEATHPAPSTGVPVGAALLDEFRLRFRLGSLIPLPRGGSSTRFFELELR